jgi:hypothetical protein
MFVARANVREPHSLVSLRAVFDTCLERLEALYGECDRSQLIARQQLIATRIIDAAEQGVTDPDQLEKRALAGLLPEYPH